MSVFILKDVPPAAPAKLDPFLKRLLLGALGKVITYGEGFAHRRRAVAETRALARMSDHILRDIGISRSEVEHALLHGGEALAPR